MGHYARECHLKRGNEQMHANLEKYEEEFQYKFHQAVKGMLNGDWLLLDNKSTVDQFAKSTYLKSTHSLHKLLHAF